jgi:hypothetical protein
MNVSTKGLHANIKDFINGRKKTLDDSRK